MYKYLPSKKFTIIVLVIILIIFILVNPFKKTNLEKNNDEIIAKKIELINKDTDGDRLMDWEEILWKTDINNIDTDGDGTTDGDEVKLKRDPAKPNTAKINEEPTDKISEKIVQSLINSPKEETIKLTSTEKISRELFLQFLISQNQNGIITTDDADLIIKKSFSALPQINFKIYTRNEISNNIVNNDSENLKKYGNDIAQIILINLRNLTEDITNIVEDASNIESSNYNPDDIKEIFKRFDPIIIKNKTSIDSLLTINVPEYFITEHLKLVNSFQEIYESLDLMKKSYTDSIILVILKNNYSKSVLKLSDNIFELAQKIYSKEIIFDSEQDYGHQLFNVIMLI
jgi:hypothetical protein